MLSPELVSHLGDFVSSQRDEMIELIRCLVEVESPSTDSKAQSGVRELLTSYLEPLGFKTTTVRGGETGDHLYARPIARTQLRPAQLVVGHYDTVWPIGTLATRPFEVEGNLLRGPGSFDMKGGLAQLVIALRAIRAGGVEMPLTPLIFVNGDEEIGSRSSGRFVHQLARRSQRAFVLEPALGPDGVIKTTRKGVGRFTITAHGKAAHAGLDPEAGASAILELSHVIQSLFSLNDPVAGVSVNVGKIDGGMRPNVVAPRSSAVVDVRVPTAKAAAYVEASILGLQPTTPGVKLEISGGIGRPALESTARNRALWAQAQQVAASFGMALREGSAGGGSDGNTTSLYTATLDGMGAVGDGAHAVHEHLNIDRSLERAALLAGLLLAPALADYAGENRHE